MDAYSNDWPLKISPNIFNAPESPTATRNEEHFQPDEEWL